MYMHDIFSCSVRYYANEVERLVYIMECGRLLYIHTISHTHSIPSSPYDQYTQFYTLF